MRVKLAALALAIASLLLLPSRAKADTFIYNVTSTFVSLDVTFDEPTFQEAVTTTTFTTEDTSSDGPVTDFSLSGNSTGCAVPGASATTGPCFAGDTSTNSFVSSGSLIVPTFTGPGTFTATIPGFQTTTVTITDVPGGVPEPSSLLLLGCGLFGLLAMASFGSRIRRLTLPA